MAIVSTNKNLTCSGTALHMSFTESLESINWNQEVLIASDMVIIQGSYLNCISKSCELQVSSVAAQVCTGLHSQYTLSSVNFTGLHRPLQPTAAENEVC